MVRFIECFTLDQNPNFVRIIECKGAHTGELIELTYACVP